VVSVFLKIASLGVAYDNRRPPPVAGPRLGSSDKKTKGTTATMHTDLQAWRAIS